MEGGPEGGEGSAGDWEKGSENFTSFWSIGGGEGVVGGLVTGWVKQGGAINRDISMNYLF